MLTINNLPDELIMYILEYLSIKNILQMRATTPYMRILCEDNYLWYKLLSRDYYPVALSSTYIIEGDVPYSIVNRDIKKYYNDEQYYAEYKYISRRCISTEYIMFKGHMIWRPSDMNSLLHDIVDESIIRLLINLKCDVNCLLFGQTPLHRAVCNNELTRAKILLENGANPLLTWPMTILADDFFNYENRCWYSLIKAVKLDNYDMTNLLLQHGADVNFIQEKTINTTSIIEAIKHNNIKIIELLLQYKADIFYRPRDFRGNKCISAIDLIFRDEKFVVMDLFIKYDIDIDMIWEYTIDRCNIDIIKYSYLHTPIKQKDLHKATGSKNISLSMLLYLFKCGLQINMEILMFAIKTIHTNSSRYILKYLIRKCGNLNVIFENHSPLTYAISINNCVAIKLLLENGANPNMHVNNKHPLSHTDDFLTIKILILNKSNYIGIKSLNENLITDIINSRYDVELKPYCIY